MFKLMQSGSTSGDQTTTYDVRLDKDYTLGSFIDAILKERSSEWGNIEVENKSYRYSHGKLLSKVPKEHLGMKIISARAHGGWSLMDYRLKIKCIK